MGVDPGTKRVGVAVSDRGRSLAFPRPSVPVDDECLKRLGEIVEDEDVSVVVVGRPVSLAGRETSSTAMADELRAALAGTLGGVEVVAMDERLTTASAQRQLASAGVREREQREIIDSAAAVVLLQAYLDAR